MLNRSLSIVCTGLCVLALPAWGGLVISSDAGASLGTAQDLTRTPVTEIQGNFGLRGDDPIVNLFKINIAQSFLFSAFTTYTGAFGVPDPELFLFNSSGSGIYFNDDISAGNTQSCLPAKDPLTSPCKPVPGVGPIGAGIYYLGISYSANGALDSVANPIFTNSLSTDVVGPNAGAGPLAGFDGNVFTQPNSDLTGYDISISGASAIPEPASSLPLILIFGSLLTFKRIHSPIKN